MTNEDTLAGVKQVLVTTLGIEDRIDGLDADTPLFGSLPELDSLAVVELTAALEDRFDFVVDDSEFGGEIFETVGSLAGFVQQKLDEA